MNYLKKYDITDEQIQNIENVLLKENIDIDLFIFNSDKIEKILNLFLTIGVNNLYDVIITAPDMFCDTISSIEARINKYEDKEELANLINEDANNLILVDLM